MPPRKPSFLPALAVPLALALAACAPVPLRDSGPAVSTAGSTAPAAMPCPPGLPDGTRCFSGTDGAGASYVVALPAGWDRERGVLVVHSHGGPELGTPKLERSIEDLERWKIMVRAGHAWAGSTFRQGGVEVRSAAEDTERLRRIVVGHFGTPRRTVLHGQSWGAGVAARAAEIWPASWDGVLLTSGVVGGGTRSYDFRLDLRVVWQAVCNNHPRPNEPQYPLWQGLPLDSKLTRPELAARVDECTGVRLKREARSPAQQQRLDTILKVVRVEERSLPGHLNWATWHFQDIAFKRLNGGNAFGNLQARYQGSPDDAALNRQVARYGADPSARARFAADTNPTGQVRVPVLTMHSLSDPVAFVELESVFRDTVHAAGRGDLLVQTYVDVPEHSYLGDPHYPALVDALLAWVDRGDKPTPAAVAARCREAEARFGPGCQFRPGYTPPPLSARTPAREP